MGAQGINLLAKGATWAGSAPVGPCRRCLPSQGRAAGSCTVSAHELCCCACPALLALLVGRQRVEVLLEEVIEGSLPLSSVPVRQGLSLRRAQITNGSTHGSI